MKERYKEILISIIKNHLPQAKIYLFGSQVTENVQPYSDIDLALDCGHKVEESLMRAIKNDIYDSTIPCKVDVIDVWDVDAEFLKNIKNRWKELEDVQR
ncbi:nucleotidyltransferase domain-containing protein [Candidatus Babeliales bacterium]|nr:nucleotidyltransferase domain-containing protein [Candidatus Babeliales bacterium]